MMMNWKPLLVVVKAFEVLLREMHKNHTCGIQTLNTALT